MLCARGQVRFLVEDRRGCGPILVKVHSECSPDTLLLTTANVTTGKYVLDITVVISIKGRNSGPDIVTDTPGYQGRITSTIKTANTDAYARFKLFSWCFRYKINCTTGCILTIKP